MIRIGLIPAGLAALLACILAAPDLAAQDSTTTGDGATAPATEAPAAAAPPPETVVAVVNGKKITRADVILAAQSLPAQYQQQIDAIFPALIDRQVDMELLAQEGHKRNLEADPEVQAQLARLLDDVIRDVLVSRHLTETVTEEAIKARYDKFVGELPAQTEVHASHVLLESEAEARAVIAELVAGAEFAAVAKAKSKDPSALENGGDLGYFVKGQMVPEFSEAAFALEKDQVSTDPVQSQFGWHVIKVHDRREKTPPSLEEARPQIMGMVQNEAVTGLLADLRSAAAIERFNPDGTPAAPAAEETGGSGEAEAVPPAETEAEEVQP